MEAQSMLVDNEPFISISWSQMGCNNDQMRMGCRAANRSYATLELCPLLEKKPQRSYI